MSLHDQLREAIEERKRIAEASTPGPWEAQTPHVYMNGRSQARVAPPGKPQIFSGVVDGLTHQHIALNDPTRIIRACERDLKVLRRHLPAQFTGHTAEKFGSGLWCSNCRGLRHLPGRRVDEDEWPCDDVRDLADEYGIKP